MSETQKLKKQQAAAQEMKLNDIPQELDEPELDNVKGGGFGSQIRNGKRNPG